MRYGPSGQYGRGGMAGGAGGGRGISKPRMQRGFRDATGQLIVDHDDGMDNLSDKEIYARNIPAIGECLLRSKVNPSLIQGTRNNKTHIILQRLRVIQ